MNELTKLDFYSMFTSQLAEVMENHLGRERQERPITYEEERAMEIVSEFLRTHTFEAELPEEITVIRTLMERYDGLVERILFSRAELN